MKTLRLIVHGRVQGVGYRAYAASQATALGLTGYVRNMEQRNEVEVVACGNAHDLDRFIDQLRKGPAGAVVTGISTFATEADISCQDFTIRY